MTTFVDWEVYEAETFCESVRDGTHSSPKFVDDGHPLITSKAIKDGRLVLETVGLISEQDFEAVNQRSKVDQWDILYTMIGTLGEPYLEKSDDIKYAIKNVGLFKCGSELKGKWLYYWLSNPVEKRRILQLRRGASQQYLPLGTLRSLEVRFPKDKTAATRIVEKVAAYDDLIENNRRRIALLEEAARHLYKEWFVRFRFPGHEHVKIVDGVPEGWETKLLGEIATTNAASHKAKQLPDVINYIDISSVQKGWVTYKSTMNAKDSPGRARRIAKHGDIIWSNVRPNLRAFALVLSPEKNDVFSTGFTILSAKTVPFVFLYQAVTTDVFVSHLVNNTTGAS